MADEPVQAPAPDTTRAELDALRKELEAERKARAELDAKHASEMGQVAEAIRASLIQNQPKTEQPPEDEAALISRKDLKAELERVRAEAGQVTEAQTRRLLKAQRESHRKQVEADPFYAKWKDEIEAMLDQAERVDPHSVAAPDAYAKALRIAKANHWDEVEAEWKAKAEAEREPRTSESGDEEEEVRPSTTRPAVSAPPSGGAARPISLSSPKREAQLDPAEDRVRRRMGLTVDDWHKGKSLEEPDPFGFAGRSRV